MQHILPMLRPTTKSLSLLAAVLAVFLLLALAVALPSGARAQLTSDPLSTPELVAPAPTPTPDQAATLEPDPFLPPDDPTPTAPKTADPAEAPTPQCSDGIDNDDDGLVDAEDAGCHLQEDIGGDETYLPQGDDEGLDDDGIPPPQGPAATDRKTGTGSDTTSPDAGTFRSLSLQSSAVPTLTATLESLNSQLFPYIFLNIQVTEDDTPLLGLTTEDFACAEDGVDYTDAAFAVAPPETSGGVRLADIVFLIDTSGSMGDAIAGVKANVTDFATQLAASSVDYRLGLVQFGQSASSGDPRLINGGSLTADTTQFATWVNGLTATGGTEPAFLALRTAAQQMAFRPGAQKIFILITDEDSDDRNKAATIDLLQANSITVHVAAQCTSGTSQGDFCDDTSVRAATGGELFSVAGPYDQVLTSIASSTAATYIVRYKSGDPAPDATERQVRCTVTAPSGQQAEVTASYTPGTAPIINTTLATRQLINEPQPDATPSP